MNTQSTQLAIYSAEQVRAAQSTLTSKPHLLLTKGVARALVDEAADNGHFKTQLVEECQTLMLANQPAHAMERSALVRRLMNHYRQAEMSESDFQGVVEDWLEDLRALPDIGPIPFDVLRDGMAAWRQSGQARFKPMPGDILALCKTNAEYRMRLANRAAETLRLLEKTA